MTDTSDGGVSAEIQELSMCCSDQYKALMSIDVLVP